MILVHVSPECSSTVINTLSPNLAYNFRKFLMQNNPVGMATEQPKLATEEAKMDLFEDDDEFEEFEIDQEWDDKEGKEIMQQWEDDWDDDDVNDDFSLQLRRELEKNSEKATST